VGALAALLAGAFVPVDRLGASGRTWWTTPVAWVAAGIFLSLALVHVPGIGREVNGARRWISIGPVGLQPSEIAKWGVPIILAWYAVLNRHRIQSFKWGFLVPLGAVSALCGVIALEDLGTAVLIEVVSVAMLLAAGTRWTYVAALAPLGLLAFVGLIVTSPYRVNRIAAFLDPYKDPQGIGYHIIQSMEAIACGVAIVTATVRGGAASAVEPSEPATGTTGGSPERPLLSNYSQLLGFGIVLTVGLQALINVCVVTGLAPTKGIALPLMSRGGTGWILTCLSLGMLVAMERASDRRRRELGVPVPGEGEAHPFADRPSPQPAAEGTAGTA
jgi:cell division protein FtsW